MVNFGRSKAEAQHVVQIKIVQFIRANQLLGLLGDGAVLSGGQQFGADGRIQNIQQHIAQLLIAAGVGHILHNVTHQRFGHARVDTVHAHMVAVVGGPAEGQLAQVTGADDKAAVFVGVVHQLQRAHAGLAVLKGDIVGLRVLANVRKMAVDGVGDVDLGKADTQRLAQNFGVGAGAFSGAEAGHRQGYNFFRVAVQHLAGTHGHQQSQTAVQSAGDAQHGALGVGMLDALGEALRLDAQDQLTAFGTGGGILGHKRRGGDLPRQGQFHRRQLKLHAGVPGGLRHKGGVALALLHHAVQIQLGHSGAAFKGGSLGQQGAVFGNQVMPGKGHIGGAFAVAGVGVEIGTQQPCALPADKLAAVGSLADGLIAGGKVGNHGRAGQCQRAAGGHGAP